MSESMNIQMNPIGLVETDVADADISGRRRTLISDIVIFDEHVPALLGISDYSHIVVLFWMHDAEPSEKSVVHPRGNKDLPLTGILASRGRGHPNPIGLAVCDLLNVDGGRLTVRRLGAYNGTPILDIKPYDSYDAYADIRMPEWLARRSKPTTA